jgi:hypothetical protein
MNPRAYFRIAVPFPNDAAPFKVIRTFRGKSRIVDSAATREVAECLLAAAKLREEKDSRLLRP